MTRMGANVVALQIIVAKKISLAYPNLTKVIQESAIIRQQHKYELPDCMMDWVLAKISWIHQNERHKENKI